MTIGDHDPATGPGCLHAALQDDGPTGGAAAWAAGAVGAVLVVLFGVALYLIASNALAVLAR
jgi:hypothetical protein